MVDKGSVHRSITIPATDDLYFTFVLTQNQGGGGMLIFHELKLWFEIWDLRFEICDLWFEKRAKFYKNMLTFVLTLLKNGQSIFRESLNQVKPFIYSAVEHTSHI